MEIKILGLTCRVEILIITFVVGMIAGTHLLCSCSKLSMGQAKEGMETILGAALKYKMGDGVKNSWETQVVPNAAQDLSTHQGPRVPLAPGQLDFFANNTFSPDCCDPPTSGVSNSDGCACVTQEQVNYISSRGGNSSGYSEM